MSVFHIYIHLKNEIKPGMRNEWEWHKLKKKRKEGKYIYSFKNLFIHNI